MLIVGDKQNLIWVRVRSNDHIGKDLRQYRETTLMNLMTRETTLGREAALTTAEHL